MRIAEVNTELGLRDDLALVVVVRGAAGRSPR